MQDRLKGGKGDDLARAIAMLEPGTIHDIAARVFWAIARVRDVEETIELATKSEGFAAVNNALAYPVLLDAISDLKRKPLSATLDTYSILGLVALELYRMGSAEQVPTGTLHISADKLGRSPGVTLRPDINVGLAPKDIAVYGGTLPMQGSLFIRPPLPAVVLSTDKDTPPLLRVRRTKSALGFSMPLLFMPSDRVSFQDQASILVGGFLIPVREAEAAPLWREVIPNSVCFVRSMDVTIGNEQEVVITTAWQE